MIAFFPFEARSAPRLLNGCHICHVSSEFNRLTESTHWRFQCAGPSYIFTQSTSCYSFDGRLLPRVSPQKRRQPYGSFNSQAPIPLNQAKNKSICHKFTVTSQSCLLDMCRTIMYLPTHLTSTCTSS